MGLRKQKLPASSSPAPVALAPTVAVRPPLVSEPQLEAQAIASEAPEHTAFQTLRSVGDAVTSALELERERYEIALIHAGSEEVLRTGLLVSLRDLEVLGSAAHFYSESYENPERRFPQVLARRERARRMGRTLWRFAVDRCGIEEADKLPSRVSPG